MNIKPLIIIGSIAVVILIAAALTKCAGYVKYDEIVKQDDKSIYVKQYKEHLLVTNDHRDFYIKYDSAIYKYKQNEILYDGILKHAQHNPHIVLIRTTKKIKKGNKTYTISKNERAEEIFSCDQVTEFEEKIGKRIVVTKVYYPREKYYYKFP